MGQLYTILFLLFLWCVLFAPRTTPVCRACDNLGGVQHVGVGAEAARGHGHGGDGGRQDVAGRNRGRRRCGGSRGRRRRRQRLRRHPPGAHPCSKCKCSNTAPWAMKCGGVSPTFIVAADVCPRPSKCTKPAVVVFGRQLLLSLASRGGGGLPAPFPVSSPPSGVGRWKRGRTRSVR